MVLCVTNISKRNILKILVKSNLLSRTQFFVSVASLITEEKTDPTALVQMLHNKIWDEIHPLVTVSQLPHKPHCPCLQHKKTAN
jgi:hypothetical protein